MDLKKYFGSLQQLMRFGISGALSAAVGVICLYVLTDSLHVWYLASSVIGFIITFTVAFCLQKYWTFKNNGTSPVVKQVSLSLIITGLVFFVNILLMYILVDKIGIHYTISQLITYGIIGILDFFAYKFLVFK